ncbi:MAG: hypothetical protein QOJ29_4311 [Thermoleophilaceae bacterium]|nr:hypothetical protein [Thermoleophilaceae bacterium]
MRPVPIRLRLTAGFALVMAVLLAGSGLYMHNRVAADLDAGIDRSLRSRVVDLTVLLEQTDSGGLREARSEGISGADFAQVVSTQGRVLDSTTLPHTPILSAQTLATAKSHGVSIDRVQVPGFKAPLRVLAKPVVVQDHRVVLVAGASLTARDEALARVGSVMVVGGPVLLVLACLAAYALAALALRPVERMRQRARGIWTHGLRARLPQTGSNDELDRLAATLNESLDRVENGVRREQGFVADASHELRTPLTVLRAQLELLGDDPTLSPALVRAELASAIEEVDRLSELADHMLLLARVEAGELGETSTAVEVAPLLERVCARAALIRTGPIHVVGAAPGLEVHGVERRIEQALTNLVDNALSHGGTVATIEVRVAGESVELHVLDDGPGVPPGFAAAAFERFTRGEAARTTGGSGLGMAIVRGLAEAQGGTVGAMNRADGGADVWLSLPLAAPATPRPLAEPRAGILPAWTISS